MKTSDEIHVDWEKYNEWLAENRKEALAKRLRAAENCAACLEHARELGYLGEGGSTDTWAKSSVAEWRAAKGETK